jgi:hypothetical protein
MATDLIVYIPICLFIAGFVRRVGEVFAAYETQTIDTARNNRSN